MNENTKINIIVILLVVIIAALVGMQIYNMKVLNQMRNNINTSKMMDYPINSNVNQIKSNNYNKKIAVNEEPPYGSKEYFDRLYKQNRTAAKPITNKPKAQTVNVVPISKAAVKLNSESTSVDSDNIQVPVGKTISGDKVLSTARIVNNQSESAPKPSLSPSNMNTAKKGIDALREPDFGPYMRDMQRRIKKNWNPPKGSESKRVVLTYKIAKDGSLIDVNIVKSSGDKMADEAAIKAIKNTRYYPLPNDFQKDYIDIQFTFDYNVFNATKY